MTPVLKYLHLDTKNGYIDPIAEVEKYIANVVQNYIERKDKRSLDKILDFFKIHHQKMEDLKAGLDSTTYRGEHLLETHRNTISASLLLSPFNLPSDLVLLEQRAPFFTTQDVYDAANSICVSLMDKLDPHSKLFRISSLNRNKKLSLLGGGNMGSFYKTPAGSSANKLTNTIILIEKAERPIFKHQVSQTLGALAELDRRLKDYVREWRNNRKWEKQLNSVDVRLQNSKLEEKLKSWTDKLELFNRRIEKANNIIERTFYSVRLKRMAERKISEYMEDKQNAIKAITDTEEELLELSKKEREHRDVKKLREEFEDKIKKIYQKEFLVILREAPLGISPKRKYINEPPLFRSI